MGPARGSGAGAGDPVGRVRQPATGDPDLAAAHRADDDGLVGHDGARHRPRPQPGDHARRYASHLHRSQQPALRPRAGSTRRDAHRHERGAPELGLRVARRPAGRVRGGQHPQDGRRHGRAAGDDRGDRWSVRGDLGAAGHHHLCDVGSSHRSPSCVGRRRRGERTHPARPGTRRARSPLARDASGRPGGPLHHRRHDGRARRGAGGGARPRDRHVHRSGAGRQPRALRPQRPPRVHGRRSLARGRVRPHPAEDAWDAGDGAAAGRDDAERLRAISSSPPTGLSRTWTRPTPRRRRRARWCGWIGRAGRRRWRRPRVPTSIRACRRTGRGWPWPSRTRRTTSGYGISRAGRSAG